MFNKVIENFFLKNANRILKKKTGLKEYQNIFEELNQISLRGMNIGGGADTNHSGEKNALLYINKKLIHKDELVVFDVGANVGNYTILLYEVFGNKAKIFSFEPSIKTFSTLSKSIGQLENISLFNFGFGAKKESLILYSDNQESGLASIYKRRLDHFNIEMSLEEEIEIKKIDSFCDENNIENINFLKLDIEGNELNALRGAAKMLENKCIDFIQFEFGGCNIDSRTYFQDFYYLLNDNYIIYRILINGLYRINNYKEMYEAFTTTNYLAERKLI